MIMKTETRCSDNTDSCLDLLKVTPTFTHGVVKNDLYKKLICGADKNYEYVFTNICECVENIRNDFGENVKIIGIALGETEEIYFSTLKNHGKVYDYIPFVSDSINLTISNIREKINKNMNTSLNGSFTILMNPPYHGNNRNQIYPKFWKLAIESGAEQVCMIFPSAWQNPTDGSGLSLMNKKEIKEDKQIVYINNISGVFDGVAGANNVNIVLWKKNYDNGLNGFQKIYTNGENEEIKKLPIDENDKNKLKEVDELVKLVKSNGNFESMCDEVSYRKPYGLGTDFLENPEKYGYPRIDMTNVVYLDEDYERESDGKICIFGRYNNRKCFVGVDRNYVLDKMTKSIEKYKVFIPKSWGNNSGKYGECGGSYSFIVLGFPFDICTEIYLESGSFDTLFEARCHSKYIMTKFVRFLLLDKKNGPSNSKSCWESVPKQNYKEEWWKEDDISKIDEHLFEKYSVPENIRECIRNGVQPKTITDIKNYNKKTIKPTIKNEENSICTLW